MSHIHFDNISDYCAALAKPAPVHPLFNVSKIESGTVSCITGNDTVTTDFYAIALKNVISGDLIYGKTKFDFQNGTMVFFAPNQRFSSGGMTIESEGNIILIHPDFIRGTNIEKVISRSSFFSYAVNEALHLSPKEERVIELIFETIEQECKENYDEYSKAIILSQLATLLNYSDRFYRRQFLLRKESNGSLYDRFIACLDTHTAHTEENTIPQIQDIATKLNLTSRYLSDALKAETGKSAKECLLLHLIERAKSRLMQSNDSVSTIAYSLGFEYPQYFARLFKNKVGITPTQYRNQH